MRLVLLAVLIAVTAAPGGARDLTRMPEATPAGEPQQCLRLRSIRASQVRNDHVIDFETSGGRVYRNTLPQRCPGLGFEEKFSYKTSLDRLCSADIITVLQSPGLTPGPSCGLGDFQPVTLAGRHKR